MSQQMLDAVQAYYDCFNAGDAQGIADLYAEDATVTDPVGTPAKVGKAAILAFYEMAVKNGARLEPEGQTRIAGNIAAFAFKVIVGGTGLIDVDAAIDIELPPGSMTIHVIDTFAFNADGKVTEMRAHWGPMNIEKH